MNEGILSAIGNTPVVRLAKVIENAHFALFAKLESLNPGGSMKDRAAISMLSHAIETGVLKPGMTVIESSSGNMGVGLALACSYLGLQFICVVDPKTTPQNIALLKAYGARIELVAEPDPRTGEFLQARLDRVRQLLRTIKNSYWPDQYSNLHNPLAHRRTMHEIITTLGEVDYIFCATSTCGTLRGCSDYIREQNLRTKIFAVDAVGSVIFGGKAAKRLIPGHGAAVKPQLFNPQLADQYLLQSDLDCLVGCRRLARRESILGGGSSGAVVMAIESIKDRIETGSVCVAILADRGERYLDTIYSDEWVLSHFGEVSHLWEAGSQHPHEFELPQKSRAVEARL